MKDMLTLREKVTRIGKPLLFVGKDNTDSISGYRLSTEIT